MFGLERRKLIFVGGKGGVGKTTTAGAIAVSMADAGRRTLVVSTDPAHSLGDLFAVSLGDERRSLAPNLDAIEIDPDAEAERYITEVSANLRSLMHPDMYHEIDRQMKLARAAPGGAEAAMLERVAKIMTSSGATHDVVVFDTAPTGQTLRLLSLPEIMTAWTDGLLLHRERADEMGRALEKFKPREQDHFPFMDADQGHTHPARVDKSRFAKIRATLQARRDLFAAARDLLLDASHTGFVIVINAERLPILESSKALIALREFGISVAGLVVNRLLPKGEPGSFLERRRERESAYLRQIDEKFAGVPRIDIPMLDRDVGGLDAVREVAARLNASG